MTVISPSGIDGFQYSRESLMQDYRYGLVLGLTFCLFTMPLLNMEATDVREVDQIALSRVLDGLRELVDAEEDDF